MNIRQSPPSLACACTLAVFSAGAWALHAVTPEPAAAATSINAVVDAGKTFAPVNPNLYGMFIEHIGSLVYSGVWAEMIDDRKFYDPITAGDPAGSARIARGGPGRFGGVSRRWSPVGPAESITMDARHAYVGDHSPAIALSPTEPRGIRQSGLTLAQGKEYTGRIVLAADAGVQVSVSLVWGTGEGDRQSLAIRQLSPAFTTFPLAFQSQADTADGRIEITATGSGSFRVGAVSLMPSDNVRGFRPEAIAALKSLRSGVYRFPGGNFVSAHEWRNAIGDPDKRPPTWDPVRRGFQTNDIGTDEFMTLCELIGVEPYITVNAGTGDAWSAAQYVEYANGDAGTPMGKLRAANGHPEPYRVKFWGIGNEMWGLTYQYGAMKLDQFEFKHNEFAKAMRKVDPTITLLASGAMPDTMTGSRQSLRLAVDNVVENALNSRDSKTRLNGSWESFSGTTWEAFFRDKLVPAYLSPEDWTGGLLSHCFDHFDLISEHFYNYGNTHFSLAEGRQVPNDPNEPVTDWMRRAANHIRIKVEAYREYEKLLPRLAAEPKPIAISEWAYTGGRHPVQPALAWVFHEMFRHTDLIHMANYTFATSLLGRDGSNVSLNANGLVFKIYRDHFGTIPVEVSGNSPQPKPTDPPGGEQPVVNAGSDTFPLDVVAAWTADRKALTVAVINPTESQQTLSLQIRGAELAGQGTLSRMVSPGRTATTGFGQGPSVKIEEQSVERIPTDPTFAPFSINIYEFPVK
ncbi:MAG: alpha-N-arabinofuranosidase [Planctomycetes bacterium]|nr:alpha-N-arabinofuranosidase [Planctomycetota bacterium]